MSISDPCVCPVAGYCERFKMRMAEGRHAACAGTNGWSPKFRAIYLERLSRRVEAQNHHTLAPVGDALTELIEWFGVHDGGCKCKNWRNKLNRRGAEWARANMGPLTAHLQAEAWKRNLPIPQAMFVPLVNRAISMAEKRVIQ